MVCFVFYTVSAISQDNGGLATYSFMLDNLGVQNEYSTISLTFISFFPGILREETSEQRLVRDLLTGYDKRVRPVMPGNTSLPLNVTFGLALSQIIDVVSLSCIL